MEDPYSRVGQKHDRQDLEKSEVEQHEVSLGVAVREHVQYVVQQKKTEMRQKRNHPNCKDERGRFSRCHESNVAQGPHDEDETVVGEETEIRRWRGKEERRDGKTKAMRDGEGFWDVLQWDAHQSNQSVCRCQREDDPVGGIAELRPFCDDEDHQAVACDCYERQ